MCGASGDRLGRGHDALLIADVGACGADPRDDLEQPQRHGSDGLELLSAADQAGAASLGGGLGSDLHELGGAAGVASFAAGLGVLAGQHGDREDPRVVPSLLDAGAQVGDPGAGVHGDEAGAEAAGAADRPGHGVGDVVQFEVEEQVELGVAQAQLADDTGTLGDEQLEADLEHADVPSEAVSERERGGSIRYIEGDDQARAGGRHGLGTYEISPGLASAPALRQAAGVGGHERLDQLLREAVAADVTPGCVALVWRDQALRYAGAHGMSARVGPPMPRPVELDTIYDLASLTKVLSTTTLVAQAIGHAQLRLEDRLPSRLAIGEYQPTLRDLLEHASGLAAHREFFHAPWSLRLDQRAELIAAVCAVPVAAAPRERAIYTDLGFLLLGAWLEQLGGARLDVLFAEQIARPLGLTDTLMFGSTRPLQQAAIAATEVYDAGLHGGETRHWYAIREAAEQPVARGLVHDDNCLVMGGAAGHAGLFGTAMGVLGVARAWLERKIPGLDAGANARVWDAFSTPSTVPGSTRRLGFDGTSPDGSGSTGTALSARAIGHLGFTGTSVWIDPHEGAAGDGSIYVLLSNRVHPTREDTRIRELRRDFHALAAEPFC